MHKRTLAAGLLSVITSLMAAQASAATLPYTPSSSLPVLSEGGLTWPLKGLNDGKGKVAAESINGFGSSQGTGTITFKLDHCAKVDSFEVWNNINRTTNGITNYTLRLYGATNHTLLKTVTSGTLATNGPGGADVGPDTLQLGGVPFVGSIDMEITRSDGRIEIREVEINGSSAGADGVCCP